MRLRRLPLLAGLAAATLAAVGCQAPGQPTAGVVFANAPPAPVPTPAVKPAVAAEPQPEAKFTPGVGPVTVAGETVGFDRLVQLSGAGTPLPGIGGDCASCGGAAGGCAGGNCDGRGQPVALGDNFAGRFLGCVYDTLCNPDPCYKPRWEPLADTAFVTAAARPVTQTRLGWNYTREISYPDRGEFFFARSDGKGRGPAPEFGQRSVGRVDMHELYQTTETATGKASVSVTTPYRSVNPEFAGSHAGFGDITIGTKSLLLDTDLLLVAFQFNTTVPSGRPGLGLGTGHVSLEPSVILGLRVSPTTFVQAQIAEWIPLGADSDYGGAMLHYHLAFNQVLWKPSDRLQLIGTLEAHGYSFQDGGSTDLGLGFRKASDHTSGQLGVGSRLFICDQYDLGVGGVFGVTGANQFGQQLRVEARVRY